MALIWVLSDDEWGYSEEERITRFSALLEWAGDDFGAVSELAALATEAYEAGYADGAITVDTDVYADGMDAGYVSGYDDGHADGYIEGYDDGKEDAISEVSGAK